MRFTVLAALGLAVVLPLGIHSSGLLMNYTNSVPIGLYRRAPASSAIHSEEYAVFCLPSGTLRAAQQAGLGIGTGDCPSGVAPILKPLIYPSPEHPLTLSARGLFFEGKLLGNTAPKTHSKTGAVLQHYPFGVYVSGAWAVSDFNRDSFDSRYFGPVAPDAIRFYAKPVWTW